MFEQKGCSIPKDWSQLAANVVASKYFFGELGKAEREHSVQQLIDRVAGTVAEYIDLTPLDDISLLFNFCKLKA